MNSLNRPEFLLNNKTFQTIYGRNLLHELNIIIPNETLIVTMEDLWDDFSNFFTKAAGTVDPPEQTVLIADKSRDENSGCSIIAISIAGTPNIAFERYVSLNSKTNPGSNCSTRICVALFETAPRTHRTQPPV